METSSRLRYVQRGVPGLLAGTLLLMTLASQATAQWRIVPELRIAAGDETDLVIDPELTGSLVPGGPFSEVAPAITTRRRLGSRGLLELSTFATVQRFLNDESRLLYAHTVSGDALWRHGRRMQGRLSLSGDYFDDSERGGVRRLGAGGEVGLAVIWARLSTELWTGGRARRYPNIDLQDDRGQLSTYAEATWSGGTTARIVPHKRFSLELDGTLQRTYSRDPLFDSESWRVSAGADTRLVSKLFLAVSGAYQWRHFTARAAGEDDDEYRQFGAGVRYALAARWSASLRWGYSTYTWPDGSDEDSHRLAVGIGYTWGRRDAPLLPGVDLAALAEQGGSAIQQRDSRGRVRFRVHAPGAKTVSVAGSFNGWSEEANPLGPAGGGWWEGIIDLVPGTYEYAYIIDGRWTTPPEAPFTADDGFGGTNGILEILPSDA